MKKVTIVYHSDFGLTAKMAQAVGKSAKNVEGVDSELVEVSDKDMHGAVFADEAKLAKMDEADAIIFGCPTHMGGVSTVFKAFMDSTAERWVTRKWANKIAGGFTISGIPSGDKLTTLQSISLFAAQHGMIWVGLDVSKAGDELGTNIIGSYLGAIGQAGQEPCSDSPNKTDIATGEHLGSRIAKVAKKMS